jgi:hypothetical protein
MIIAMAISAIVVMGSYSLFNTIFKAQTTTSENLFYTGIYNNLSKMINNDFINMIELSAEQKKYIDNKTKIDKKNNNVFEKSNREDSFSPEQSNNDNQSDNKTDNKTQQNYIVLNKLYNYPQITFSTYNSLFFNKAFPVIVSYYIDEDNYFVRSEKNEDLDFSKEIKLIGNIEDFEIYSFNGEEFIENIVDPKLMRFIFKINTRTYQISACKFIKNEK